MDFYNEKKKKRKKKCLKITCLFCAVDFPAKNKKKIMHETIRRFLYQLVSQSAILHLT